MSNAKADQSTDKQIANLEVDDIIVLLLGAPSSNPTLAGRLKGVTRLEKLMFLIEQETNISDVIQEEMDFTAHNFGPFSAKIYQMLDVLAAAQLVKDSSKPSDSTEDSWEVSEVIGGPIDPFATRDFELTERGRRYYQALIAELPRRVETDLSKFKDRFGKLPLRQLVRYVYQNYPDYTENSVIKDEILNPSNP